MEQMLRFHDRGEERTHKLESPSITVIFFYPLILVPVPIQLGKIASKSNELGFFISVHVMSN